jgi:hypothetical protein
VALLFSLKTNHCQGNVRQGNWRIPTGFIPLPIIPLTIVADDCPLPSSFIVVHLRSTCIVGSGVAIGIGIGIEVFLKTKEGFQS